MTETPPTAATPPVPERPTTPDLPAPEDQPAPSDPRPDQGSGQGADQGSGPASDGAAPGGAASGGTAVPPLTAFAWRHRLVRPVEGRIFAGVCGAFARATNTDPVLWRVILAVLTVFGGVGVVLYLAAWLLLPADGDTGTPLEALSERGHSRTSTMRTIAGIVLVIVALAVFLSEPYRATPLIAILLLGGVLLLLLRDPSRAATTQPPVVEEPTAPTASAFAPHGPFAPHQAPVTPPPPLPAPRPRSRAGRLTLSVAVLLLGGLVAAELAGVPVHPAAYFALPLAVLGVGLVVSAWVGRARGLIPLGIVLSLLLGASHIVVTDGEWRWPAVGQIEHRPATIAELESSYERSLGQIELDLRSLDFSGRTVELTARVDIGNLEILVPRDVDVEVTGGARIGDVTLFGQSWGGIGNSARTVSDLGEDGVGGGTLRINATVGIGNVEVYR